MLFLTITDATVCEYLLDNSPVLIFWHEATGELLVELGSFALFLGYASAEEMMRNDAILDIISDQINRTGESPFRRIYV